MAALMIDFENVKSEAFKGAEQLLANDKLYLFYSEACPNMSVQSFNLIIQSGCEFKAIELVQKGHNFLDMYIASAIGELIGSGFHDDIAVISNDKGFQSVVDYWGNNKENQRRIIRASSIGNAIIATQDKAGKLRRKILSKNIGNISIAEEYTKYCIKKKFEKKLEDIFNGTEYEKLIPEINKLLQGVNEVIPNKKLYLDTLKKFGRKNGVEIYRILKTI